MAPKKNLWHPAFAFVVMHRGPKGIEVHPEYQLGAEPPRLDLLLIKRRKRQKIRARFLRHLWKYLPRWTVIEFKSTAGMFRSGDWIKLLSYAAQYDALKLAPLGEHDELAMVLVVPRWTPTLESEYKLMNWTLEPLEPGYYRVCGGPYPSYLVLMDEVAEAEQDPLLALFAGPAVQAKVGPVPEDIGWSLMAYFREELHIDMDNSKDYRELAKRVLKDMPVDLRTYGISAPELLKFFSTQELLKHVPTQERLEGVSTQERLEGVTLEERMAGLSDEERVLGMPNKVLRALPQDFIQTLPEDVQAEIQRRLST